MIYISAGFLALDFHSGTILQAKEECGINGLPSGAKISEFYRLAQVIKEGNISKLWLGIKRHLFPPTWVSEESPKGRVMQFCNTRGFISRSDTGVLFV